MEVLNIGELFPATHEALKKRCHDNKQVHPTVLILQYGEGGFNTSDQDLYGDIYFPMQLVLFLNEPGDDFTGGEFVLMEQIPRAQPKRSYCNPGAVIYCYSPPTSALQKGSKGYYRVNMKHGVSPVHTGHATPSALSFTMH